MDFFWEFGGRETMRFGGADAVDLVQNQDLQNQDLQNVVVIGKSSLGRFETT